MNKCISQQNERLSKQHPLQIIANRTATDCLILSSYVCVYAFSATFCLSLSLCYSLLLLCMQNYYSDKILRCAIHNISHLFNVSVCIQLIAHGYFIKMDILLPDFMIVIKIWFLFRFLTHSSVRGKNLTVQCAQIIGN